MVYEKIDGPKGMAWEGIVCPGVMESQEINGPKAVECKKFVGHGVME